MAQAPEAARWRGWGAEPGAGRAGAQKAERGGGGGEQRKEI